MKNKTNTTYTFVLVLFNTRIFLGNTMSTVRRRWFTCPARDTYQSLWRIGPLSITLLREFAVMSSRLVLNQPTLSQIGPTAILSLAREIEPDALAAMAWYREVPIKELGNRPAQQLFAQGQAQAVIAFLTSIVRGERG
jgi:hypothetical protein